MAFLFGKSKNLPLLVCDHCEREYDCAPLGGPQGLAGSRCVWCGQGVLRLTPEAPSSDQSEVAIGLDAFPAQESDASDAVGLLADEKTSTELPVAPGEEGEGRGNDPTPPLPAAAKDETLPLYVQETSDDHSTYYLILVSNQQFKRRVMSGQTRFSSLLLQKRGLKCL